MSTKKTKYQRTVRTRTDIENINELIFLMDKAEVCVRYRLGGVNSTEGEISMNETDKKMLEDYLRAKRTILEKQLKEAK